MLDAPRRFPECKTPRVGILTGASLAWNPRALKEARSLSRAGFEVVVYGASMDREQVRIDRELATECGFSFKSVIPMDGDPLKSQLLLTWRRIRTRIGSDANRYLRIENSWQLGPGVVELAKEAAAARADYYIAHLEQGAWAGVRLRRAGFNVGVDMEDWYSDDLPIGARKRRPLSLLRNLEKELLSGGLHATCPSRAMSEALAREFGCEEPAVVYNAFPWADRKSIDGLCKDRMGHEPPSIHWFSQTIGSDRGLDDLLRALPLLKHQAQVHLRGKATEQVTTWLKSRIPEGWRERVVIHEPVPNRELLSRISEHDIGLASEVPGIRNKDLTVSNKILYYLLAGLAVLASDTAGQREIATQVPGGIFLYPSGDASALAVLLDKFLASKDALVEARLCSLDAARRTFCWERQENTLLAAIHRALSSRLRPPALQRCI
jgi:glycosyltransferase involved in cell wall biosynthesis